MKKALTLLLAAALLFAMAACGGTPASTGSTAAEPAPEASAAPEAAPESAAATGGSLRVALWDKNQEVAITPILKEWGAANGVDISVEVTPWSQYWTMLEAAASGGDMPDVFWMHTNQVRRYAEGGMLMDLTDRIAGSSIVDMSQFPQDLSDIYNIDGKQYGVPKDMDTVALWYNKTMFDEAGVAYPDASWTWDDLKAAAKALTKDDGSQYGFVASAEDNQAQFYNFIYQNDGYVINEEKTAGGWTDPKTVEAMEFFTSFVEEGLSPDAVTTAENSVDVLLETGTVAMGYQASYMMGALGENDYIIENFDCTVLPAGPNGTRATIYNGLGWSAAAGAKNPDAAWALIEYLGGEEAQVKMAETTICNISAHAAGQAAWGTSDPRFNLQAYIDQVPEGIPYPTSYNTVAWDSMTKEKVGEMLTLARPVADVCQDIQTTMDQALAEETPA